MRKSIIVLSIVSMAFSAAPAAAAHPGEAMRKVRRAVLSHLFGDVTAEEKDALLAIGREFLEGAKPSFPALRLEARSLHEAVRGIVTEEQRSAAREFFLGLHALSLPEKLGRLREFVRSIDSPEARADLRTFLRGAPEDRMPAGERIARRVAERAVAIAREKAGIGEEQGKEILKAFDSFLEKTRAERTAVAGLAREKLKAAWNVLTPEQKERVKGARRMAVSWLRSGE
jgi:hypothetical protein